MELSKLYVWSIGVQKRDETRSQSHVIAQRTLERAYISLKDCHPFKKEMWSQIGLFTPFIHQKHSANTYNEAMPCLISQYLCPPSSPPSPVASSNMPSAQPLTGYSNQKGMEGEVVPPTSVPASRPGWFRIMRKSEHKISFIWRMRKFPQSLAQFSPFSRAKNTEISTPAINQLYYQVRPLFI